MLGRIGPWERSRESRDVDRLRHGGAVECVRTLGNHRNHLWAPTAGCGTFLGVPPTIRPNLARREDIDNLRYLLNNTSRKRTANSVEMTTAALFALCSEPKDLSRLKRPQLSRDA